jgi:uncharacterized protein (DUF433 family)
MDWTNCPDVERRPDVLSGRPVVAGTRIPADTVVEHADLGFTAEEIVSPDLFPSVTLVRARRLIAFARQRAAHPAG